jgi:hypothetical protein
MPRGFGPVNRFAKILGALLARLKRYAVNFSEIGG